MKKIFAILVVVLICFSSSVLPVWAERPSCEELVGIAAELDDIADELARTETIEEDGFVDRVLEQLVDELLIIAEIEDDVALTAAVEGMEDAWIDMDSDRFERFLDSVILRFEQLFDRDC